MIFDRYVIVDWSARNRPRVGKDSVWVCVLDADGRISAQNPPTRGKAELIIRDALRHFVAEGQRVLVGFDFPYGYPAGLAAALDLAGPPWRAVWQYLVAGVRDDGETNASNRFEVAARINASLQHQAFWAGHPRSRLMSCLPGGTALCTGSKPSRPGSRSGGRSRRSCVRAGIARTRRGSCSVTAR